MSKSILNFDGVVQLNKKQQKMIFGGKAAGTCGYILHTGHVVCNVSMADAQAGANANGSYWCCDSCRSNGGNASYC